MWDILESMAILVEELESDFNELKEKISQPS